MKLLIPQTGMNPNSYTIESGKNPKKPKSWAGNFAVVVPAAKSNSTNNEKVALRFFLAKTPSHITQITSFINSNPHDSLVGCKMYRNMLQLKDGETVDMMEMDFVQGLTLDDWVENTILSGDSAQLLEMAEGIRITINQLVKIGFYHGDLSHSNIMVSDPILMPIPPGQPLVERIRLIDYDSVLVEGIANVPETKETGHPNFQHPSRKSSRFTMLEDVYFTTLVIYVSLIAVSQNVNLWQAGKEQRSYHSKGDNLIFQQQRGDLENTDTQLWDELNKIKFPGDTSKALDCLKMAVNTPNLEGSDFLARIEEWFSTGTIPPNPLPPQPTPNPNPGPSPKPGPSNKPQPSPKPRQRVVKPKPSPKPQPRKKAAPSPKPKKKTTDESINQAVTETKHIASLSQEKPVTKPDSNPVAKSGPKPESKPKEKVHDVDLDEKTKDELIDKSPELSPEKITQQKLDMYNWNDKDLTEVMNAHGIADNQKENILLKALDTNKSNKKRFAKRHLNKAAKLWIKSQRGSLKNQQSVDVPKVRSDLISKKQKRETIPLTFDKIKDKPVVIDGTNILYESSSNKNILSLQPLKNLIGQFNSDNLTIVFDASTPHKLSKLEKKEFMQIVDENPGFTLAPKATEADSIVLNYAHEKKCIVISNDFYPDYIDKMPEAHGWFTHNHITISYLLGVWSMNTTEKNQFLGV